MRSLQIEYILKGIYLGLLLDVALKQAGSGPFTWQAPATLALCTLGGLVLALAVAALIKLREGYRVRGRVPAFVLFLLLESPTLVYAGILLGTIAGAYLIPAAEPDKMTLRLCLGGAALGLLFGYLRDLKDRRVRLGLSLLMAGALAGAAFYYFGLIEGVAAQVEVRNPFAFGVFLLVGLPVFYLLTFAGEAEESEVEIGAVCATLGLALTLLTQDSRQFRAIAFLLPVLLFFWYTLRVLPGLRVFKHVLRGMSHAAVGRYAPALIALRRALHLDPNHQTAREEFWRLHASLDLDKLSHDPELLALVDFELCVQRAGSLLVNAKPGPNQLAEAYRLLKLVSSQQPAMRPQVEYWRAVALTHEKKFDQAADALDHLLDPTQHDRRDPFRRAVLLQAWQLVLMLHDELRRRVGQPQLSQPGRRMEAIGATERHLAENPEDAAVWPLKRLLYQDLGVAEFQAACREGKPPAAFDYAYVQEIGTALVGDAVRWQRGCEYLRMAAIGQLAAAPGLYARVAEAYEKAGQKDEMWRYYGRVKQVGQAVGHKDLPEQERHTFFRVVKALGEEAVARGDLDAALDDFHLYAEYERSGVETLRTLAALHEKKGDALAALRVNDQALVYNAKDKDLLERKDRYYYSVTPELLKANLEAAAPGFDVGYCLQKGRSLLDTPNIDFDLLDWAQHLVALALVVQPDSRPAKVLQARVLWRRGEVEEAASVLESVRTPKPEKFAGTDDEDAWYVSCQLLGDLYLNNLGRADLAAACLQDFKKSPKSGAKTLYRLGQAYEQLGDAARAARCYEQVTAYEGNPLAPEARDALDRLAGRA